MKDINLNSARAVRRLLEERGIRPRKRWGQHFLCDGHILEKVVEAARLRADESVFEIGAGLGTLTRRLATVADEVIAVEIDPRLVPLLRDLVGHHPHVKVLQVDVLQLDWETSLPPERKLKALGNLPYGITSPLLEKFIAHQRLFREAVWMIQREVAEKLLAEPGTRGTSALGIFVRAYCEVEMVTPVSKDAFYPRPEVDSALLRLTPLERPRFQAPEAQFRRAVRAAFAHRRKTLRRALGLSPQLGLTSEQVRLLLERVGVDEGRRGETLSIEEFDGIARELAALRPNGDES